jgi:hypothetical protein
MERIQQLLGRIAIAIGDINVGKTSLVNQPGCIVSIFEKCGWLGVGVCDALTACFQCVGNNLFWECFLTCDHVALTRHQGDLPVLAPLAAELQPAVEME